MTCERASRCGVGSRPCRPSLQLADAERGPATSLPEADDDPAGDLQIGTEANDAVRGRPLLIEVGPALLRRKRQHGGDCQLVIVPGDGREGELAGYHEG